ncbi:hypothetical protein AGABI2DRAFT_177985 [Agaricus bisporus var. bisporus H97]|uniref:hypothetical protein n=1 Tax=Agaricus bisporus var. bisporus (strain H97 / ATCC MYA-4626 / FGSC 10389) TaxID=936046 RepID=UPI00029F5495|nr:hypothetical protein AGABI2DRAFT_177985 [Agaricus bisporus var. bisporus H97]EKV48558.1 hypothetical protein AGABI2DRAFT_177985 [Agaricus bisporus var. bisporus H97]
MDFKVASVTIMALDWLLTMDMEVSLMWRGRWNVTKVLYFLTRYLPFIDTSVVMYRQFGTVLSPSLCRITYEYAAWTFIIGMGCAELILSLRTYAVWNKDKRLLIGLPLLFISTWTVGFIVLGFYLSRTTHGVSPVPQLLGCIMVDESSILSACYIVLMIFDACVLALMAIRGISALRSGGDSQFMRVVYSDGIIYYVYLSALSIFNTVIILRLPARFNNESG